MLVTLDGRPALCANLNCDFTYYSDASVLTSQLKSGLTGRQLTVTGTSIPFNDILKVTYGLVDCAVTSKTDTNIACTLADIPVAGLQTVQVLTVNGILPVDATLFQPTLEALVVSSVTPKINVNYLGGDILVFAGSGFGTDAKALNVTFDDGTVCDVISVTSTYFSC